VSAPVLDLLECRPAAHGREAEAAILDDAVDRAAAGRLAVVLIDGEAGIGKTRLLQDALEQARGRGLRVAAGRAAELEQARPFGLVAAMFGCTRSAQDPRRAAIGELLARGDGGDGGDQGHWGHWGPVTVTSDPGLQFRVVDAFAELDERAVAELVTDAVGVAPGRRLLAGISGAAGNPLFVTELLGALAREQMITIAGGQAEVADSTSTLPPALRLTILSRISFLAEGTLQALRFASVLGTGFTLADLAEVTGRSAADLSMKLAEPLRARVLEDDGTRLRFRHDLIRDAIYQDLPASVRGALHREAGQRLAAAGAPAAQVAEHLAREARRGDGEAIGWLAQAARQAAVTAPEVAAGLFGRAIGLTTEADEGRDRLMAERAGTLLLAGRVPAALAACRELLDRHHDPDTDGRVRICLAQGLLVQGQARAALGELDRACRSSGISEAERAAAHAWAGFARVSLGDLDGAAASERAAAEGAAADDHLTTSIVMSTTARIAESRGDLGEALEIAGDAVRRADMSPGRMGHRFPVRVTQGRLLIALDRLPEARSALSAGVRVSEELGVRWALATHRVYLARERFAAGYWDDALAELEVGIEVAEEAGEIDSLVLAYGLLSRISLHRNDLHRAREAAGAGDRYRAGSGRGHAMSWVAWPRALICEAEGQDGQALSTMAALWDWCADSGQVPEFPVIGADLVRLARATGDVARARQAADAVAEVAARNDLAWMTGEALRCRGLADDDPEALQASVAAHGRGSRPLRLAMACEDAGSCLARHGQAERARPLLDRAAGGYERLGAARSLARAEAALREAGGRRGRRGRRGRPRSGWDSITPIEHSVADLVAEGLSNPQIGERLYISSRTVQTHLAHVFAKLDISARAQLAVEVTRRRPA
jgi:DNA-binding CsgD family transcriptional regulator